MADTTGTSVLGLQFLAQGAAGEKYGYLTIGTFPKGFTLVQTAFFYSEMQFTSLVSTRDAVYNFGKNIYRSGALLYEPGLPSGAFFYYYAIWRKGGIPWKLTTF
jgi:hypothetical protein